MTRKDSDLLGLIAFLELLIPGRLKVIDSMRKGRFHEISGDERSDKDGSKELRPLYDLIIFAFHAERIRECDSRHQQK